MRKTTSTNTENRAVLTRSCVLNLSLERLALRCKMPILAAIAHGASSYGELRKLFPAVSDQVLATRLRELVEEGLAVKTSGYTATRAAEEMLAIMDTICDWEVRWSEAGSPTPASPRVQSASRRGGVSCSDS